MGTNGTEIAAEPRLEEEILRIQKVETPVRKRTAASEAIESSEDFVLAPLVDKIAYGIARGLVVAVKELENHIANETRKVGDAVDRRFETLQTSLQDLYNFVGEQRSTNIAVEGQLKELTVSLRESESRQSAEVEAVRKEAQEFSTSVSKRIEVSTASLEDSLQESKTRQAADLAALQKETRAFSSAVFQRIDSSVAAQQETNVRQAAELAALQNETRASSQSISERVDGLCKDFGIQQEDIAAIKTTLCTFSSRVDTLVERLDRQAEAVRSMCTAYSQRETELEQLVDGLARLRAFPTPLPKTGL